MIIDDSLIRLGGTAPSEVHVTRLQRIAKSITKALDRDVPPNEACQVLDAAINAAREYAELTIERISIGQHGHAQGSREAHVCGQQHRILWHRALREAAKREGIYHSRQAAEATWTIGYHFTLAPEHYGVPTATEKVRLLAGKCLGTIHFGHLAAVATYALQEYWQLRPMHAVPGDPETPEQQTELARFNNDTAAAHLSEAAHLGLRPKQLRQHIEATGPRTPASRVGA